MHETSHECVKSCLKGIFPMCGLLSGERQGKYSICDVRGIGIRQSRSFRNLWHDEGEGGGNIFVGSPGEIGELSGNYASTFVCEPCQDDVHIAL